MPKSSLAAKSKVVDLPPSWQRQASTYVVGRAYTDGADHLAHEMERKWGCGRLRLLVDNELRARFDSQRLKLNQAIRHGELEDVMREGLRMQNAWRALDAAAASGGAVERSAEVWEITLPDGRVAALVRDCGAAGAILASGRAVNVYTLDEIANLIHGFPEIVKIKETFPGAEVTRVGPICDPLESWDEDSGDEISF